MGGGELEENLRRKDLTEIEKSRNMVELEEIKKEQAKTMSRSDIVSGKRGPQKRVDSTRSIAQEIGVSRPALIEAKQHVQAVDKYPDLEPFPKKEAIKEAKKLDALPPEKVMDEVNLIRVMGSA